MFNQERFHDIIVLNVIENAFQAGIQLYLVLKGIKPGEWLEYTVPHIKHVICQIESLISMGAPLVFLEPEEVERVKLLEFEDFSEVQARRDFQKIIDHDYPHFGLKYHNTAISSQILKDMREDCSKSSINETPEQIIRGTYALGKYFGYPDCCIKAFIEGSADTPRPYTEHRWCSPNCSESLIIQKSYKEMLNKFLPDLPPLGSCFSPLKN